MRVVWSELGYQDGLNAIARSVSRANTFAEKCPEHGMSADWTQYQLGYDRGIKDYCTPEQALLRGSEGNESRYETVCLHSPQLAVIKKNYRLGRVEYLTRQTKDSENQLQHQEYEVRRCRDDLLSLRKKQIAVNSIGISQEAFQQNQRNLQKEILDKETECNATQDRKADYERKIRQQQNELIELKSVVDPARP
jgi:hypothetical protein